MQKYKDTQCSPEERIEDLLQQMDLSDKIAQLGCCMFYGGKEQCNWDELQEKRPGSVGILMDFTNVDEVAQLICKIQQFLIDNTKLKIPALIHIEALTGGMFPEATAFPTSLSQASTWNPALVQKMADCIRKQLHAVGFSQVLSPVFDICRDPRWGRLTETYGEDETLASAMAVAYVSGIQGKDYKKGVAATGKHFIGHGSTEGALNMSQNLITERELKEVHCKPFQAAISQAGLMSVMNSYCSINREPIVSSQKILTDILRKEMGFEGLCVSDYASIDRLLNPFQVVPDHVQAGVLAMKAGIDVEYPSMSSYNDKLIQEVESGRLDIKLIDRAVRRILKVKFDLGLFENPFGEPEKISTVFHTEESEKIAESMALQAVTLMKNDNDILPLSKDIKKIAIVGPHADRMRTMFGNYTYAALLDMQADDLNDYRASLQSGSKMPDGIMPWGRDGCYQRFPGDIRETPLYLEDRLRRMYPKAKTLYEAVCAYLPEASICTAQGISYTGNNLAGYEEAINCAANADLVIMTLGGQDGFGVVATNGEGIDNSNIDLPGRQEQFARDIYALHKNTVVVHIDGRPLCNKYVYSHFDAIIEAWHQGESGFLPLVKILFGEESPSGRLPVTIARGSDQLPVYYGMPRGSGYRNAGKFGGLNNAYGYINTDVRPLFPFGYGLSYSKFVYRNLQLEKREMLAKDELLFSLEVENTGMYDGAEVVQVYVSDCYASMVRPEQQLVGFFRLELRKDESKQVNFKLKINQLAFLNVDMKWKVEAGDMELQIGASCEDIRLKTNFRIDEDQWIDPKTRSFFADADAHAIIIKSGEQG